MTRTESGRKVMAGVCWALTLSTSVAVGAQTPAPIPQTSPSSPSQVASDPLERDTPVGTVRGFNTAVHNEQLLLAARYLQLTFVPPQDIEWLARDLNDLLDRHFTDRLTSLSAEPAGRLDDGLPADRERLLLTIGDAKVEIFLTRVDEPGTGTVWLFSSDSLSVVPAIRATAQPTWLELVMPRALVARSYAGASLAQWILLAASLLVPLALWWTLAFVGGAIVRWRIVEPTRRLAFQLWWKNLSWLLALSLALITHLALVRLLGFSLTFRFRYARAALIAGVLIFALLFWRLVSASFQQARVFALRRGRTGTESLLLLGERVVKVFVVLVAILGILGLAGLDLTTALAGVGIAGVALALGAQKSVENLLGGIFLLSDNAFAVGDFCRLSDREGWIEDITLRSVRLRTLQHTLLLIPAGLLAQGNIENFSTRRKILLQTVLRLRYHTTATQLEAILDGIRRLLAQQPQLEHETARIRLKDFGAQAIELELFAYALTTDYPTFLGVREQLLLKIAAIVESSGGAFAGPTEFIHLRGERARQLDDAETAGRPPASARPTGWSKG